MDTDIAEPRSLLVSDDKVRTLATLLAIVVVASVPVSLTWPFLFLAAGIAFLILFIAGISWRRVWRRLLLIIPFGLLSILFLPWMLGGPKIELMGFMLSQHGIFLAVSLTLKLVVVNALMTFLLETTSPIQIMKVLREFKFPEIILDMVGTTYRYIALLADEAKRMVVAQEARGMRLGVVSSLKGFKRAGALVSSLFMKSLNRSERIQQARESRTFAGNEEEGQRKRNRYAFEIKDLSYRYRGANKDSLCKVNLTVPSGSKVAIMGVNGAGKSTLLLHLNGIHAVQQGELVVDGLPATSENLNAIRRMVGVVFQDPDDQVFAPSVWEDVCFGPEQQGLSAEEIVKRAEIALDTVAMGKYKDSPPFALSYGERKRVAIAGVLAMQPEIVVLDEPMAFLDPAGKDSISAVLESLHLMGKTIIIATHDVDLAAQWAEQVVLMSEGTVAYTGDANLLVDEEKLNAVGLRLPLVTRPFRIVRDSISLGGRLPRNVTEASRLLWGLLKGDGDG